MSQIQAQKKRPLPIFSDFKFLSLQDDLALAGLRRELTENRENLDREKIQNLVTSCDLKLKKKIILYSTVDNEITFVFSHLSEWIAFDESFISWRDNFLNGLEDLSVDELQNDYQAFYNKPAPKQDDKGAWDHYYNDYINAKYLEFKHDFELYGVFRNQSTGFNELQTIPEGTSFKKVFDLVQNQTALSGLLDLLLKEDYYQYFEPL